MAKIISYRIIAIVVLSVVYSLWAPYVYSQKEPKTKISIDNIIYEDTLQYRYLREKIDSAENKNRFTKFIFNTFTDPPRKNTDNSQKQARPNIYYLYKDMIIDSIIINRNMPFDVNAAKNNFRRSLYKGANSLHMLTSNKIISKNLIFKVGDKLDPVVLERNENLLQELGSLTNVRIVVRTAGGDKVNVYVYTTDRFSLSIGTEYSGKDNNSKAFIGEDNFMGRGNQLMIYDYYNLGERDLFKGAEIAHNYTNLFGSFFNLKTNIGLGKDFYIYNIESNKKYLKPNDYAAGIKYMRDKNYYTPAFSDTAQYIRTGEFNVWVGKSFMISDNGVSFYMSAKYNDRKVYSSPFKTQYFNAYYHDTKDILFSMGIYKERYYRGNLIYGFDYTENIPYGFKTELVTGYRYGEFHKYPYIGFGTRVAYRSHIGYFNIAIKSGAFIESKDVRQQIVHNVEMSYFSDLFEFKRDYNMRLFLYCSYSGGENMLHGKGQRVDFSSVYRIRGTKVDAVGTTRLFISPEIVLFTPIRLLGFRFAFYGFSDLGTLGYNMNPFKNEWYNSIGLGARIKNESLVFRTIELRLAYVPNPKANMSNSWIGLSTQRKLNSQSLIPTEPHFNGF